ncbi:MFS transporter [Streptomyces sp. NPDC051079]|uniref:MFS transporter n=1 Tax=Streptomyces sp. NPDC051079 TaxID=3155043 RepID=UPI00344D0640
MPTGTAHGRSSSPDWPFRGPLSRGRSVADRQRADRHACRPGSRRGTDGTAALALLCTSFTGPRRAVALGVWSGVGATALAIGPLLGTILTDASGWRSIFLLNVPLGILMLITTRAVLPRTQPAGRPGRMDIAGGIASGVGLSALIFGLTQANTYGWGSATLWSVMGLAVAGFTVFTLIERRVTTPLLDRTLLRLPNFVAANVLGLTSLAVMCSLFFFLSLYLQFAAGFSPVEAGVALLPLSLLVAVVAPVAGWLVSRAGARILIGAGMTLTAAGLFTLAGINPGWGTRQLLPGLVIAGVGIGLATTPITTAAMGAVPQERTGIASGTLNASRMIGLSLGIAIMGAIVAARARLVTKGAAHAAGPPLGLVVSKDLGTGPQDRGRARLPWPPVRVVVADAWALTDAYLSPGEVSPLVGAGRTPATHQADRCLLRERRCPGPSRVNTSRLDHSLVLVVRALRTVTS